MTLNNEIIPLMHEYWYPAIAEMLKTYNDDNENYIGLSIEDFMAGLCIRAYNKGIEDARQTT